MRPGEGGGGQTREGRRKYGRVPDYRDEAGQPVVPGEADRGRGAAASSSAISADSDLHPRPAVNLVPYQAPADRLTHTVYPITVSYLNPWAGVNLE